MSNFQFFKQILTGYKPYFHRPKMVILDNRDDFLERNPDAWAYFDPKRRSAFILNEYNNLAVRLHEYGHWINMIIYFCFEIGWEFIWWGLGFRSLCKNKSGKVRRGRR